MKLEIISADRDHAILVGDEDHNDIAEFFHSDHATVGQSYETALMLARKLVEAASELTEKDDGQKPCKHDWGEPFDGQIKCRKCGTYAEGERT